MTRDTIHVFRPEHRHSFGVVFARGETPDEAREKIEGDTVRFGLQKGLEYIGTGEEFLNGIPDEGFWEEVYTR